MATDFDGLLELIPIDDIAQQLGVDPDTAEAAVKIAIPAIIGGMAANAKDDGGAASLEKALASHATSSTALGSVDTADGEKIVNNVFGSNKNKVVAAVADTGSANVTQDLIAKLLPILAPIVLAFIAQQLFKTKAEPAAAPVPAPAPAAPAASGGIGDLLGGLLASKEGQDMIGNVLGGLLGGGKK